MSLGSIPCMYPAAQASHHLLASPCAVLLSDSHPITCPASRGSQQWGRVAWVDGHMVYHVRVEVLFVA
jgi:hypothetical protein